MRILPLLLAITFPLSAEDWPQFLGPRRDGSYQGKALPAWPAAGPHQLWQTPVGAGFAGPAVADGKLIQFHRIDNEEIVDCLNAVNGQPIWRARYGADYVDDFRFDNGPRAVPAIAGGRVFTHGAHGMVHAWDLKTGKALWKLDARTQFKAPKGFFGFACSPLVVGNTVLLNIGGAQAGIIGLDVASGKVRWRATEEPASYASPVLATINETQQAVFFTREGLVSVDPAIGKVRFSHHWRPAMRASVNACTPVILGDLVFASTSYGKGATLLAVDGAELKTVWTNDTSMSCHYSSCVMNNGLLFGFHGRQEAGADLRCVDFKTGRVHWSQPGLRSGTVTRAGDDLLVLTERGELIRAAALANEFQVKQRARITRGEVRAYPALAQGRFYFRDGETLRCLQLKQP
jgi:outer membrane protein assembly factor BamB